jgi:hypothetical protein
MEVAKKLEKSFSKLCNIKKVMICSYWIITRRRRLSGEPMKICVSYPVDVCYVIIYTKKNGVNQNIEMLLMPPFFCVLLPVIPPAFFTRPESGFGLL